MPAYIAAAMRAQRERNERMVVTGARLRVHLVCTPCLLLLPLSSQRTRLTSVPHPTQNQQRREKEKFIKSIMAKHKTDSGCLACAWRLLLYHLHTLTVCACRRAARSGLQRAARNAGRNGSQPHRPTDRPRGGDAPTLLSCHVHEIHVLNRRRRVDSIPCLYASMHLRI